VIQADAIRAARQIEPPRRLDARTHREDEQGVAARIGHPAPRRRRTTVQARDVRGAQAGRRAPDQPSARAAQLEDPVAAEQHDRPSMPQRGDVAGRADRCGQLTNGRRAAAEQQRRRCDDERAAAARADAGPERKANA
jgi:hypothetical protein